MEQTSQHANIQKHTKKTKPPTIEAFREAAHRNPAKSWWSDVDQAVGDNPDDLQFWEHCVKASVGLGWNPTNVKTMLEFYGRREIPNGKARAGPADDTHDASDWWEREGKEQAALSHLASRVPPTEDEQYWSDCLKRLAQLMPDRTRIRLLAKSRLLSRGNSQIVVGVEAHAIEWLDRQWKQRVEKELGCQVSFVADTGNEAGHHE